MEIVLVRKRQITKRPNQQTSSLNDCYETLEIDTKIVVPHAMKSSSQNVKFIKLCSCCFFRRHR